MAKLMIGTEEVSKIMMGTEEVSLLSMGGETIPVSGSPAPTPTPSYNIPLNEIWYATVSGTNITSLNQWKVYDTGGTRMTQCDFSTYGKMVFPNDIGYVAGYIYQTNNGWADLTELGLPMMDLSMCIGANDFGFTYTNANLYHWTRVYGDYPYIDSGETIAIGSDGGGCIAVKGKTGTLVIPEGFKSAGAYAFNRCMFDSIEFPTTFGGGVSGYNGGNNLMDYMFEDMSQLTSIKYKSTTAPVTNKNNCWSRVSQSGVMYYPSGTTGYENARLKPSNFTMQTY